MSNIQPPQPVIVHKPNPQQVFETIQEAGNAASDTLGQLTDENGVEFGVRIYFEEGRGYRLGNVVSGGPQSVRHLNPNEDLPDLLPLATVHSHPQDGIQGPGKADLTGVGTNWPTNFVSHGNGGNGRESTRFGDALIRTEAVPTLVVNPAREDRSNLVGIVARNSQGLKFFQPDGSFFADAETFPGLQRNEVLQRRGTDYMGELAAKAEGMAFKSQRPVTISLGLATAHDGELAPVCSLPNEEIEGSPIVHVQAKPLPCVTHAAEGEAEDGIRP